MRAIFILVFAAGIGLAGFAVYLAKAEFDRISAENERLRGLQAPQVDFGHAYVATRRVPLGGELTPDNTRRVRVVRQALPPGAVKEELDLYGIEGQEPRSTMRNLLPGDYIMESRLTDFGEPATVTALLEPGMRALTIGIDQASGQAGNLRPGDVVDFFWAGTDANGIRFNILLYEAIELLMVDGSLDEDRTGARAARSVTIAATPTMVGEVDALNSRGKFFLSLRGLQDDMQIGQIETQATDLIDRLTPEEVEAPAPVVVEEECTISIVERIGGQRRLVEYPCPEEG